MSSFSKRFLFVFCTFFVFTSFFSRLSATEDEVQLMMNTVSTTTLYNDMYYLQNKPDPNNPLKPTAEIGTRRFICPETGIKADWIYEQFRAMGLPVEYDNFSYTYNGTSYDLKNVVATIPGTGTTKDGIYIIGAHYDCTNKLQDNAAHMDDCDAIAPGINDNASGVATVLETARALAGHNFRSTIKFIAFTGEEWWPAAPGSRHYAETAKSNGDNIKGMISPDMVSYNPPTGPNPNGIAAWGRPEDEPLCDKMVTANINHNVGMNVRKININNPQWSDHVTFQENGFTAFTNTQDVNGKATDFQIYRDYPYYHRFTDTVENQTFPFLAKYVQLCIATMSDLAVLTGSVPIINSISPSTATAGVQFTITGIGFGTTRGNSTVNFYNNLPALKYSSWSNTKIVCAVPADVQNGIVTVNTFSGASNSTHFSVLPPTINTLTPNSGTIGSTIIITGNNLGAVQGSSKLKFYPNRPCRILSWSNTQILCMAPSGVQTGPMTVTTSGGTSNELHFTVSTPQITDLNPNYGVAGTTVTITGTNFGYKQGNSLVTFYNNQPAKIISWLNTEISCMVPSKTQTGIMTVTTSGGTSNNIVYTVP